MAGRIRRGAVCTALSVLLLAACDADETAAPPVAGTPTPVPGSTAPTPTPTGERAGGTLRLAISEPDTLVPFDAVEPDDVMVVGALFEPLTRHAANGVPVPAAAASWSHDDDASEWTFVLRDDGAFHDGTPVTAADVAFAWTTAVTEGTAGFHLRDVVGYTELLHGQTDTFEGVEVVDELTLRVRLHAPQAQFPSVVANPALAPVPGEAWREDPEAFAEQPIGNGPFAAAEARVPGQFIRLQRAPEWAGPAVALDEILFRIMDPETAYVAFQQERLHMSPLPEGAVTDAVERYGESPDGYRGPGVLQGHTPVVYLLGFDVTQPPFDDVDVRRAITLAIDRERIAEEVLGGTVVPADALVAPAIGGQAGICERCRHDPEAAADLLADRELGSITFWFNRDGGHRPIAERVRADLAAVGLSPVVFHMPTFAEYLDVLEAGDAGFFRYGWRPEYPSADDVLRPLFHSEAVGDQNFMRYARDDVDALLDDLRASTTAGRRLFAARRAEDLILNRDQAVVPLLFYRHQHVVAERVEGLRLDPLGRVPFHEVRLRAE